MTDVDIINRKLVHGLDGTGIISDTAKTLNTTVTRPYDLSYLGIDIEGERAITISWDGVAPLVTIHYGDWNMQSAL